MSNTQTIGLALLMLLLAGGCNSGGGKAAQSEHQARLNIKVGDQAPDFSLAGYPEQEFTLSSYRGRNAVVLYFYPKDKTPDCTTEACAFRDTAAEFARHGAVIVGVSRDDLASHTLFADDLDLPFALLSDEDGSVRELYGNPDGGGTLISRITYVIDQHGIVTRIINGKKAKQLQDHIDLALEAVKEASGK